LHASVALKIDAAAQIKVRRYSVKEVTERLGINPALSTPICLAKFQTSRAKMCDLGTDATLCGEAFGGNANLAFNLGGT